MKVRLENRLKTGMKDTHFNVVMAGLVLVNGPVNDYPFNVLDAQLHVEVCGTRVAKAI